MVMIVRCEDDRGVFAAIFSRGKEREARKLYQRMVKDVCGRVAVVELLDSELHTIKLNLTYNSTQTPTG